MNDKPALKSLSSNSHLNVGETQDEYSKYESILDTALSDENKDNNNIAITGKYGSGKSSIIDTYFSDKDNYLRVSFANFKGNTEQQSNQDSNSSQNSQMISNIINQVIYQIDNKLIPLTKFRIKREISFREKFFISAGIILALSFIPDAKNVLQSLGSPAQPWIDWFRLVFLTIIIVLLLFSFLSKIEPSKFKLTFKNFETEINTANDDLFEKYADEITYLFEKSGKRILIIEDLDRFNDISIFEKLRELNIKLNNKSALNQGKHWQFIYLIKDTLFKDESDRVKFFDLIIPVIPFITTNNSYYKFKNLFPDNNPRLLYILSLYIDDYRLLLNISNEYKVFTSLSSVTNQEDEKDQLLSLLTYKNLYPDRFDDLQNGKGELADILNKFKTNIKEQITSLQQQIDDLNKYKETTVAKNEAELLLLYALENTSLYKTANGGIGQISSMSIVKDIISQNLSISTHYNSGYLSYQHFLEENAEYYEKLKAVTKYTIGTSQLKQQIQELKKMQFKDISKDIFEADKFNELLYVLITEGYITRDYLYVINHYYGDSVNRDFMKKLLTDDEDIDITTNLSNINDLMNKLQLSDYSKKQILNLDLLKYLFKNNYTLELEALITTASNEDTGILEMALEAEEPSTESLYHDIIETKPNIHFNLLKFKDSEVLGHYLNNIISNNYYDDTPVNEAIIVNILFNPKSQNINSPLLVINTNNVYPSLKELIIKSSKDLYNLDDIKDNHLQKFAMQEGKITPSIENILSYFKLSDGHISSTLIQFINQNKFSFKTNLTNDFYKVFATTDKIQNDSYYEFMEHYTGEKFTTEQIDSIAATKVKILFELNLLPMEEKTIALILDKNIDLNSKLITDDFRTILMMSGLSISNHKLLFKVINKNDSISNSIFSQNLDNLAQDEIVTYLKNINSQDSDKIIKIIKKSPGYRLIKLTKSDFNLALINWIKEQEIITDFNLAGDKISIS